METKHTPLPWKTKKSESKPALNVIGTQLGGTYKIARCPYFPIKDSEILTEHEKAEANANAEFIVKACNSYNDMRTALHNALVTLQGVQIVMDSKSIAHKTIAQIEAALAL